MADLPDDPSQNPSPANDEALRRLREIREQNAGTLPPQHTPVPTVSDTPRPPMPPEPVSPSRRRNRDKKGGGVKETVEQILVAFILAFIFRTFIVEAFVIPTGSMAPTLLGAHMRFTGPQTGYDWTVNYSAPNDGLDVSIPPYAEQWYERRGVRQFETQIFAIRDPITGRLLSPNDPADPENDASGPPVHYGDRILVLKYAYLFKDPSRWDVVVFKNPNGIVYLKPEGTLGRIKDYSQNYIKRLIGRPGEAIMLLDGDVYIADTRTDDYSDPKSYHVQTKPDDVQNALWRIVYDNDYLPPPDRRVAATYLDSANRVVHSAPAFEQPWQPVGDAGGWDLSSVNFGRTFQFDGTTRSTLAFNPEANSENFALTDWLAYDVTLNDSSDISNNYRAGYGENQVNNVSDIRLEAVYQRRSGDGELILSSTKRDHLFQAVFAPDHIRLMMTRPGESTPIELGRVARKVGTKPTSLALVIADWQAKVMVGDETLIASTPDQFSPDVAQLIEQAARYDLEQPKPVVSISAENQSATLTNIRLWRDIFYTDRNKNGGWLKHAVAEDFPRKVMVLGDDEFFPLGDNSVISLDAREWDNMVDLPQDDLLVEPGRVPRRFLLGRAFFVYWPAGERPLRRFPAILPNFGDMRFIH